MNSIDIELLRIFVDQEIYDFDFSQYDKHGDLLSQDRWLIICNLEPPKMTWRNHKIITYNDYIQMVRDYKISKILPNKS